MSKYLDEEEGELARFREYLKTEEKSRTTVEKYERDARKFLVFVRSNTGTSDKISKTLVLDYKEALMKEYRTSSVNSMLAAVNNYLIFSERADCKVKQVKIQRQPFLEEDKCLTVEDVEKLLKVAKSKGKQRLAMIIETLYGTGIRVSELAFITLEHLRSGAINVHNKGKTRLIAITKKLRKKLLHYAKVNQIQSGPLFVTRSGKCMNRSNLWREIQKICEEAGVASKKGFPHNFRRLFARCFYAVDKDLVNLADILGHSSIETTRIYTATTYKNFVEKLESMDDVLRKTT
ncbi:integrase/recombinase XerD [Aequitasia blattaphilus]|uniref:Tyrosine-type recombinase/integrase n=1 Tax=Aequitasia blattaphilus TaxID=2949332 RepID=A0ABT1ED68_9FIRM|nr:tyrosine-type recombinase/integrase [Aequitasia blattaphilus]MCP1102412.1 tyrosine-type recombinase/integrase [Aequitasia blattaphilus]MCR8615052.1 tyrosine-type recombinase/integrase [Aequitasia blattaphilus]